MVRATSFYINSFVVCKICKLDRVFYTFVERTSYCYSTCVTAWVLCHNKTALSGQSWCWYVFDYQFISNYSSKVVSLYIMLLQGACIYNWPEIRSTTLVDNLCLVISNTSCGGQVSYCPGITVSGSLSPSVEASSVAIVRSRTEIIAAAVVWRQVRLWLDCL